MLLRACHRSWMTLGDREIIKYCDVCSYKKTPPPTLGGIRMGPTVTELPCAKNRDPDVSDTVLLTSSEEMSNLSISGM
ncbi:hypothetical protein EJB05_20358, partial [Eragrostis curvula]